MARRQPNRKLPFHPKISLEMFEQSCRFGSGPQFSRLASVLMWNLLVREARLPGLGISFVERPSAAKSR